jgi:uncharacterized membrane protein (DUF106 family)
MKKNKEVSAREVDIIANIMNKPLIDREKMKKDLEEKAERFERNQMEEVNEEKPRNPRNFLGLM